MRECIVVGCILSESAGWRADLVESMPAHIIIDSTSLEISLRGLAAASMQLTNISSSGLRVKSTGAVFAIFYCK